MLTKLKNNSALTAGRQGFTLVELLIVMTILAVLVSVGLVSFRSSQFRSRDAQRKSDLKQIASSLELFYSDYGKYPDGTTGSVDACPYNSGAGTGTTCAWGTSEFTDAKSIYFKVLPKDPNTGYSYYYRVVDSPSNQKYQLFAAMENSEDRDCLGGDCASPTVNYACGTGVACNFSITSTNTKPTE